MTLKFKDYEPEKNGLMIHVSSVNINNISDLEYFVNFRRSLNDYHYIILLDRDDKPHLFDSLKINEDTNFYFRNNESINKAKEEMKEKNIVYNKRNLYSYMKNNFPNVYTKTDYNHEYLHINILGDFSIDPLGMVYNDISKGIYHLSEIYNTKVIDFYNEIQNKHKFNYNMLLYYYNRRKFKR